MSAIPITKRLREAAELIDQIVANKFPLLLNRILQKIHLKERAFTVEEEVSACHKAPWETRGAGTF
jgi:hypothetical protein